MRKIIQEYFNIMGYTIIGITFGLCFFLLFLNFYHYKDVNSKYIKQDSDFELENQMKNTLLSILDNSELDINNYKGQEDSYSMLSVSSRLSTCVKVIDSEGFHKIIQKKEITMKDLYEMQQYYQTNISNDCLIKQIYELSTDTNNRINISSLSLIKPFIEDNTSFLIKTTDYIQKVLKNNSSYSFSSTSSKNDIYDSVKDSYYELLNDYRMAIDYIYDISVWFKGVKQS